jgi:anti-sigma regulatory factor (Ser/Thr protein kinase)
VIFEWPLVSCLDLGSLPTAAGCARLHAKNVLFEWGLGAIADDAELLVSEMVTNALQASWRLSEVPPIALRLLASHQQLIIEVWDSSRVDPATSEIDLAAEVGRGLRIVAALSHSWGFERVSYSLKVVWCELVFSAVQ